MSTIDQHSTVAQNFCEFSIGCDYLNGKGLSVTGSAELKGRSLTHLRLDFFETELTDDGLSLLAAYSLLNRLLAPFVPTDCFRMALRGTASATLCLLRETVRLR